MIGIMAIIAKKPYTLAAYTGKPAKTKMAPKYIGFRVKR